MSSSSVACFRMGRLSPSKYKLKRTPECVTITRRHHPLVDQQFEVLMDGNERIVIRLNDGTSMQIPREWTSAEGPTHEVQNKHDSVFSVDSLRDLIRVVDGLVGKTDEPTRVSRGSDSEQPGCDLRTER